MSMYGRCLRQWWAVHMYDRTIRRLRAAFLTRVGSGIECWQMFVTASNYAILCMAAVLNTVMRVVCSLSANVRLLHRESHLPVNYIWHGGPNAKTRDGGGPELAGRSSTGVILSQF